MMERKADPAVDGGGAGSGLCPAGGGAEGTPIVPLKLRIHKSSDAGALQRQASAAEAREIAIAAWHTERSSSYSRWPNSEWATRRAAYHGDAARLHGQLAARHRAVRAALQAVRHG